MTSKEKAIYFLREYNLANPLTDMMLHILCELTGKNVAEVLYRVNKLADGDSDGT